MSLMSNAALVVLVNSCAPAPTVPTAPTAPAVSPAASPATPLPVRPVAVARNVDLFDPATGARLAHIDEADVLELGFGRFRGDSVRVRTSAGVFAGDLKLPARPALEQGLGFYVTKQTDIFPASSAQGAAPLGRAHVGAFLPVREVDGDYALVALPPFELEGRVALNALGLRRIARPSSPAYPELVENRRIHLRTSSGELETACDAPVGIVGERADGIELSQYHDGIEIRGTARSDGEACPARVQYATSRDETASPPIPAGWQRVDRSVESRAFSASAVFYWLERDDRGAQTCVEWRYKAGKDNEHDGSLTQRKVGTDPTHGTVTDISTYEVSGAVTPARVGTIVTLKGPTTVSRTSGGKLLSSAGLLCAESFALAGTTKDGLVMLPGIAWRNEPLLAYHPADARIWYTNRRACNEEVERLRGLPSSPLTRLLPPVRGGC